MDFKFRLGSGRFKHGLKTYGYEFVVFKSALENGGRSAVSTLKDRALRRERRSMRWLSTQKAFGAKGKLFAYLAIHEDGTYKCPFSKFMKPEELDALVAAMGGKPGDLLLFAADKDKVVFDVLGNFRLEIARQLDLLKKDDFKFLWVTEFPLLEYSEEEDRYVAMHHPFTMPMEEDLPLIDTDPGKVRAKAYDIVLNGTEMGGGSVRIHQADIQEKMFEVLGFTKEKAQEQVRLPVRRIQIRSTAARWSGLRYGPYGYADGRRRQHPRRHRIPEG